MINIFIAVALLLNFTLGLYVMYRSAKTSHNLVKTLDAFNQFVTKYQKAKEAVHIAVDSILMLMVEDTLEEISDELKKHCKKETKEKKFGLD